MPGTQVLKQWERPASPLLPGWGDTGKESRGQMPFLAVQPPSFDVAGWVKDSLCDLPKHTLSRVCSLSAFGGPTAPPVPRKPPFWIQKLFRRAWEESRTRALSVLSANRLSEMKELGAPLSTVPWPTYFPLRESHGDVLRGGKAPQGAQPSSPPPPTHPPTQDQPPQSFQAYNSLLSCYELLFKKHL